MANPAQIAVELEALVPKDKDHPFYREQQPPRIGWLVLRNLPTIIAALKAMEERPDHD